MEIGVESLDNSMVEMNFAGWLLQLEMMGTAQGPDAKTRAKQAVTQAAMGSTGNPAQTQMALQQAAQAAAADPNADVSTSVEIGQAMQKAKQVPGQNARMMMRKRMSK